MIVKLIALCIAGWLAGVGAAQAAGDAAAGQAKMAPCAGCNGDKGKGNPRFPELAGKSQAELFKALMDFKSGARSNPLMTGVLATLGDQDLENLAAYFASFK